MMQIYTMQQKNIKSLVDTNKKAASLSKAGPVDSAAATVLTSPAAKALVPDSAISKEIMAEIPVMVNDIKLSKQLRETKTTTQDDVKQVLEYMLEMKDLAYQRLETLKEEDEGKMQYTC